MGALNAASTERDIKRLVHSLHAFRSDAPACPCNTRTPTLSVVLCISLRQQLLPHSATLKRDRSTGAVPLISFTETDLEASSNAMPIVAQRRAVPRPA